jgi:uncharacterized coiled-coil DUF342 family protein
MEELLKQILGEIKELKENQANTGKKVDNLCDRIDAHSKSNKEEFRQLDKKMDIITEVVAKTMEDVVGFKGQLEKQDTELKVLKGGK